MSGSQKYQPVELEEPDLNKTAVQHSASSLWSRGINRRSIFKLLIFGGINLLIFYAVRFWMIEIQPTNRNGVHIYGELHKYSLKTVFDETGFSKKSFEESGAFWRGLFPKGQGIVSIPNDLVRAHRLPLSKPSPVDDSHSIYQISLFHQLHCLEMIKNRLETNNMTMHPDDMGAIYHSLHCIDWIRQALMCNSDITLDPTDDYWVFGDNSEHKCRDFSAIFEWAEQNRFKELGQTIRAMYPDRLAQLSSHHHHH